MAATNFPEVPWVPTSYSENLPVGHVLGNRYVDKRGRVFVLLQVDPILINDTSAAGEAGVLKASHVWTNDVSDALIDGTYPIFAGVALGAIPESTTGGTTRYGLFLVNGRATLASPGGTVDAGDVLILDTSVDGGVIEVDETSTSLTGNDTTAQLVGLALAAESGGTVDAYVRSFLFG